MGYSTKFDGELLFAPQTTIDQVRQIEEFLGEDFRDHEDWDVPAESTSDDGVPNSIDLELNASRTGLVWSGMEKTYGLVRSINFILQEVPFQMAGSLLAQGDEIIDRWLLVVDSAGARKVAATPDGVQSQCPQCGHAWFTKEESTDD